MDVLHEEPGTYYAAQSDLKLTAIPLPHRFNAEHTTPNPTHKMEEAASQSLEEDFEGQATHTGPKGVINDWRKFKLESEDGDSIPPSKKEILRQMSSPQSRDDSKERMSRKMSIQEYELIHQDKEDESCLRKYRRQCMQDMHQKLSFGPRYGFVYELETGEQFLETIEKEQKVTTIVVNIYEDGVRGCDALNSSLACLAVEYPMVKFCKIKASNTGAGDRFSTDVLPTLLVYKGGELISNFISVAEQFAEEFFAVDVESFLNEYGLLPEREIHDLEQTNMEDEDIE